MKIELHPKIAEYSFDVIKGNLSIFGTIMANGVNSDLTIYILPTSVVKKHGKGPALPVLTARINEKIEDSIEKAKRIVELTIELNL